MKLSTFLSLSLVGLLALAGCRSGTAGGPGAESTGAEQPLVGTPDETFTLGVEDVTLRQGESKTLNLTIKRSTNFSENVEIAFTDLPKGISADPSTANISASETGTKVSLSAASDAALGEFKITVTGHPTKGGDSTNTLKLNVTKG
jgi:hypothetical protein